MLSTLEFFQIMTYNTFDPDKPISIHLDPPSTERPPLVEIKQEGKTSIYTTDFYFTNKSPSNIMVPSPSKNNTMPTGSSSRPHSI